MGSDGIQGTGGVPRTRGGSGRGGDGGGGRRGGEPRGHYGGGPSRSSLLLIGSGTGSKLRRGSSSRGPPPRTDDPGNFCLVPPDTVQVSSDHGATGTGSRDGSVPRHTSGVSGSSSSCRHRSGGVRPTTTGVRWSPVHPRGVTEGLPLLTDVGVKTYVLSTTPVLSPTEVSHTTLAPVIVGTDRDGSEVD